jgi:NAD-dependent dihydropyrimidine dehydrogenase PreA subunit
MIIDQETCVGCGECVFTCTVDAIRLDDETATIHREMCVECGNCLRIAECPTGALQQDELVWPRVVRKYFSDNQQQWPDELRFSTGFGRGTDECKTNDRSGRFRRGQVGVLIEVGRPGVTTDFHNVEKIIKALKKAGAEMEEKSPLTALLQDKEKGILREDIKNERVLSCIIESKVELDALEKAIEAVKLVSTEIDTVFSFSLATRMENGFQSPIEPVLHKTGLQARPNAKINLGLGRPLCED